MTEIKFIEKAINLPEEWNNLTHSYFQQTSFLVHAEKYNPCNQRYYLYYDNGSAVGGAIVYSLRLDILTFISIKSPVKMNIIGIPCSVSAQGIFGNAIAVEKLKNHIFNVEKGFILILNLTINPLGGRKPLDDTASGTTLPTIVLRNHFTDWDSYIASLRSSYRRRLKQINNAGKDLRFAKSSCSSFDLIMYRQYLEVFKRSNGKLEKLSFDFFKNLPSEFNLTVCFKNNMIIGWNIAVEYQNTYYFFLGGIDYKHNKSNNTYLRLLSELIKDGIQCKAEFIELGQTAEIPKMRMGGNPQTLYLEAHHGNTLLNRLLIFGSPLLQYKRKLDNTRAMK